MSPSPTSRGGTTQSGSSPRLRAILGTRLRRRTDFLKRSNTIAPRSASNRTSRKRWSVLGSALVSQNKAEEAVAAYNDALRIDPRLAQAHNGLGAALAMQGQDDARAHGVCRGVTVEARPADGPSQHRGSANQTRTDGRGQATPRDRARRRPDVRARASGARASVGRGRRGRIAVLSSVVRSGGAKPPGLLIGAPQARPAGAERGRRGPRQRRRCGARRGEAPRWLLRREPARVQLHTLT